MRLLAALLITCVVLLATLIRGEPDAITRFNIPASPVAEAKQDSSTLVGRSAIRSAYYRLETVTTNVDMKPLHGQAATDPACCTAGVHLTYCFVVWVTGHLYYRRVGKGEEWKSMDRFVVDGVTCVAHGSDVTAIVVQTNVENKLQVSSNTISNGKPQGWWWTYGHNAREVPSCVAKGTEIYCMYRGLDCGAYILYTVEGVWQPQKPAGGVQYSPIAAWYTSEKDEFNYYAANIAFRLQVYNQIGLGTGSAAKLWRQIGTDFFFGRPSVCSHGGGTIDIFVVGASRDLLWLQRDGARKYLPWRNEGGRINYPPSCIGRLNNINCFAVSPGHNFLRKTWNGSTWTQWISVAYGYIGTPSCHFSIAGVNIISCYIRNVRTTGIDSFAFVA